MYVQCRWIGEGGLYVVAFVADRAPDAGAEVLQHEADMESDTVLPIEWSWDEVVVKS